MRSAIALLAIVVASLTITTAHAAPDRRDPPYQLPPDASLTPEACPKDNWPIFDSITFLPNSPFLVTAGHSKQLKVWNIQTGRMINELNDVNPDGPIASSPAGPIVASRASGGKITLRDINTGQVLRTFVQQSSDYSTSTVAMAFNNTGRLLISADENLSGTVSAATARADVVKLWDARTGEIIRTFGVQHDVDAVAFSPDGKLVLAAGQFINIWDTATGALIQTFDTHTDDIGNPLTAVFSPDGSYVVSGGHGSMANEPALTLWDIKTGRVIRTIAAHAPNRPIAFSADKRYLLSIEEHDRLQLWDESNWTLKKTFRNNGAGYGYGYFYSNTRLSADGNLIVTISSACTVQVWNIDTGALVETLFSPNNGWASFTPDGWFASSGNPEKQFTLLRHDQPISIAPLIQRNRLDTLAPVNGISAANAPPDTKTVAVAAELKKRMALWLSNDQAFRCEAAKPSFPSKNDYPPSANNSTCDDGDTAFFNGLLCLAGEQDGCLTVKRSQSLSAGSDYGRWWRAPTKIGAAESEGGQTTLSTDLALGILGYIAQTRDRDGFRNWVNWIHQNPRCVNCIPPGGLRYCESDLCALKPIDCLLLNRLADFLGEPTVCSLLDVLPNFPLPADFDQKFQKLQTDLKAAVNKYAPRGLPAPPVPDFDSLYRSAAKLYAQAFQAFSNLARNIGVGPLFPGQAAAAMTDINSLVNDNPHLAAVEIFLLTKKFGYDSPLLKDAAKNVLKANPKNPFFIYLANGRSDANFAEQILQKCPSTKTDNPRFQWAWERPESEIAWTKTMFWDCVFITDLYLTDIPNLPTEPFSTTLDPVTQQAIQDSMMAAQTIQDLFKQIQGMIDALDKLPPPDPVACVADISSCTTKMKNCIDNPSSCLPKPPSPSSFKPPPPPDPVGHAIVCGIFGCQ